MIDYSRMFRGNVCVICGQERTIAGRDAHTEIHLGRCEAQMERDTKGVWHAIPNVNPVEEDAEARARRELRELHVKIAHLGLKRSMRQ